MTLRHDRSGLFIVAEDGASVVWREVEVGIREGDRIQVQGDGLTGRVVTLGQQMLSDGAPISIPEEPTSPAGTTPIDSRENGVR